MKYDVENANFFIHNLNNALSSIFHFYLLKTHDSIKEVKELEDKINKSSEIGDSYGESPHKSMTDLFNKKYKATETVFNYAYSTIHAFYSYLEFILDVIYAFEQPGTDFFEFRKKCWYDRFKMLFDVRDKELSEIYNQLLGYRNKYRNPLSHGLTNEISVLVPLPKSGLVPLSYQFLSNELYYGFRGLTDITIAEQILKSFISFLEYLGENEPYTYYMRYAEYGFDIPVSKKRVEEIKKQMSCMDDFEEYLNNEAAYMDAVINRDI